MTEVVLEVDDTSLNFSYLGTLKILNRLKDKVAIITGGASGMGRASSSLFAAEGAKVAIVDRNETLGKTIESEIGALGHEAFFLKADLSQLNEVRKIVPKVLEKYGKVDILFGNAGVNILKRTEDTDEADWESMFNTNLRGHFFLTKVCVASHEDEFKWGRDLVHFFYQCNKRRGGSSRVLGNEGRDNFNGHCDGEGSWSLRDQG